MVHRRMGVRCALQLYCATLQIISVFFFQRNKKYMIHCDCVMTVRTINVRKHLDVPGDTLTGGGGGDRGSSGGNSGRGRHLL